MLRRIAILLIALATVALVAQPIETEEVVVTGQSNLRDTLRTQQKHDLDSYWHPAAQERFAYRYQPQLQLSTIQSDAASHDGVAAFDVASPLDVRLLLGYDDSQNPLLNFLLQAGTTQPDDDWEVSDISLRWSGDTAHGRYTAAGAWNGCDTPLADASISWSQLALSGEWSLENAIFRSLKTAVSGLALSEETAAADRDFGEMDAIMETSFAWRQWRGQADIAHLQSSTSGQAHAWRADVPYLDRAGVWLAGDSEHLYGSLSFQRRFRLGSVYPYISALNVFNDPGIGRVSRSHELNELSVQHIDNAKLQVKRPVDLHAVFEYNTFLPLSVGYRLAWMQDYSVYFRGADSLYVQGCDDAWMHEVNFDASYQYEYITFDNAFTWRQADPDNMEHLPWLAETENRLSLRADLDRWGAGLAVHWLGGRRNDFDLAMDDITLVDLNGYYQLNENLRLRAAITNLLDDPDHRYESLPDEGVGLHAGFDYHF